MQEGAPGYTGGDIKAELRERGIELMLWPLYSPDLNPTRIETVWDIMKDWIEANYPEKLSYNQLRQAVNESPDDTCSAKPDRPGSVWHYCSPVSGISAHGIYTRLLSSQHNSLSWRC